MEEVLSLLPVLVVAIIMNIAAGMYYSIGTEEMEFDFHYFVSGIIKALIVGGLFIGTAYCFDATDLTVIGVTPSAIITAAIVMYVGKAIMSLMKILGIESTSYLQGFLDFVDDEDGTEIEEEENK